MHKLYLIGPGPRPPYYQVAHELWGDRDFDSDGDSNSPDANDWTELTISLRPDCVERIDIDPFGSTGGLVLCIKSASEDLVRRAARFLAERSGGTLTASAP
jgi:hypothetical protein